MASISLTELAQLKKLMSMTTSTNDNEALAFLRKANAILAKYNLTWTEILSRTVTVGASLAPIPGHDVSNGEVSIERQIEAAFDEIRGNVSPGFAEYVESVEKQFLRDRYLSPAQRQPLFAAVMRFRERRARDG